MADRVVTIEIDSTAIKLMETRERKVIKWASLSLEAGIVEEGVVSDPQALSTAVKQLMASSGITAKDVIASVSSLYSVNRILTVPNVPGGLTTPEAILEAAKETIPLAADKLYLSSQTIATGEDEKQVLIIGVPREVIDAEMRALRTAGINPYILDFKAIALARAVNKEQALILNIEPYSFNIIMVVNGVPQIMRTMPWGQDNPTVEDDAEYLAVSLDLTVGFYNSHHPNTPLDPATPLIITGQISGDPILMEKLQARVVYPIEPLAPPLEYPSHLPVSQYAVNIGLSLKGMATSKSPGQGGYLLPDINLLPKIYQPWKPSARQIYFACFVIAVIALLFPLYQITAGAMTKTADLEAKYATLNNELQRRQLEIKNRAPMQKAIEEYRTIVNKGGGFTEDLRVINSQAEGLGIQVQSVVHDGETITVTCQAESHTSFRNYLAALEKSGRFSTPIPPPEGYPYTTSGIIELEPKTNE